MRTSILLAGMLIAGKQEVKEATIIVLPVFIFCLAIDIIEFLKTNFK